MSSCVKNENLVSGEDKKVAQLTQVSLMRSILPLVIYQAPLLLEVEQVVCFEVLRLENWTICGCKNILLTAALQHTSYLPLY